MKAANYRTFGILAMPTSFILQVHDTSIGWYVIEIRLKRLLD